MSEMTDLTVLSALGRQMTIAAARQAVAAGNLANVDTPGYRAREVDFDRALDTRLGAPLSVATTDAAHLAPGASAAPAVRDADGLAPRRDGNTVQLDRELLAMTEAAGDFAKAQTALSAKFRMVRYAITQGQ